MLTTKEKPMDRADDPDLAEKMKAEAEGIFLWAFEGLQRLVANNFKFTESDRIRKNREAVKRDNNNIFDFMESEGYIRLKADASISSKDFYEIYRMWCEENSLAPLKARSFSDAMIANAGRFNLEHCNNITNSAGRRVWGFMGVEAVARPHINGFTMFRRVRTYRRLAGMIFPVVLCTYVRSIYPPFSLVIGNSGFQSRPVFGHRKSMVMKTAKFLTAGRNHFAKSCFSKPCTLFTEQWVFSLFQTKPHGTIKWDICYMDRISHPQK